jgi:uncharacterized protein YfaS (alpha-2-macroglobulin family)
MSLPKKMKEVCMKRRTSRLLSAGFFSLLSIFSLFSCNNKANAAESVNASNEAFTVLAFTPEGELPAAVKFPSIQVQFSEPVVALSKLGKPTDKSDIVQIDPPIKGTFRWFGTSLLSFECSESVVPQKAYKVAVSSRTTSAAGKKISGNLEFNFHSEELKLVSIVPGYSEVDKGNYVDNDEVPVEVAKEVAVYFNAPVNIKKIQKELTVECGNQPCTFSATEISDSAVLLKLKNVPALDTEISVKLPKGSMADDGCYETSVYQSLTYHTLRPLSVKSFDPEPRYVDSSYSNPVQFIFNHQMKMGTEAEIAKHIMTTPTMKIDAKNIAINGTSVIVHSLPVTFESTYKLTFDKGLTDAYGLTLPAAYEVAITVPKAGSFASFKDYGFKMLEAQPSGLLPGQFSPKLVFEYQNIIKNISSYTVTSLVKADGSPSKAGSVSVSYADKEIPEDTKIIETVDLTNLLEKTVNGYRGGIQFAAKIGYVDRYQDWKTEQMKEENRTRENTQVIQVTDIGMTVRYGYNRAFVLVTSLRTGKPITNAKITAYSVPWELPQAKVLTDKLDRIGYAETNAQGLAIISFTSGTMKNISAKNRSLYIEAKTNDDRAIFQPDINSMWRTEAVNVDNPGNVEKEKMVAFIFTDRGLYKPGETMTFRGIDRSLINGKYSTFTGKYVIEFTDGAWKPKVFASLKGTTSENGTFWGQWKIPSDLEPGTYAILYKRVTADGERKESVDFQVEFFERLRFEAKATVPAITFYSGDKIDAEVSAQYLGGGSLAGCSYNSYWSRTPSGFYLKGSKFDGMSFGPIQGYDGWNSLNQNEGVLSGDGKATLSQQTGGEKLKGMTYSYQMEAQVTDSGNQMISASTTVTVHPARFYIGISKIKDIKGFPTKGDTLHFDYLCVTPEGAKPAAKDIPTGKNKNVKIELLREDWKEVQQIGWNGQINTRYVREMVTEQEKNTTLEVSDKPAEINVVPSKGGSYLLRLSTKDARGNDVISEKSFYVTSSDWTWFDRDDADQITMTCDKDLYSVGDTAHILMQSPLPKGTYVMTIEREGIISQEIRTFAQASSVIDVPVTEDFIPVMYMTLSSYSVRTGAPKNSFNSPDLDKPKGYFGLAAIHVEPSLKKFDVQIKTDKPSYKPGETAKISLHASKNGVPLSKAEITLMAVDRGVIDLINYHVANPVSYFYDEYLFPDCVKGGDSRSLLIDPVTYEVRNLLGGDELKEEANGSKITERKNFEPTALFVPDLVTDDKGDASYSFTLPDSLTSYRITAVGAKENIFAIGESEMPVANPVSVRDVLPRKLRVNDRGETGVTISNLDAAEHNVTIKLAVYDGAEKAGVTQSEDGVQKLPGNAVVLGGEEKTIMVDSNKTVPLMFTIEAKKEGWITIEYTVTSDVVNEKILKPLEIEKPYIYETVATVGEVRSDDNKDVQVQEKIVIPQSAEDGKGQLYVQLDPTRLGVLRDAVGYVFNYPYGCMEQRSAFVFPLIAFGDYIKVLGLDSEVKKPLAVAKKEIESWGKVQHADGGFPYWPDGNTSDLFVSMRIGEILALAQEKGIVKNDAVDCNKLASYIQAQMQTNYDEVETNACRNYIVAYANYVISRLSDSVTDESIAKVANAKVADISSLAFCALTYLEKGEKNKADEIAKQIRRYTKYSTRGIDITSTQKEFNYWSYFNDKSEDYALLLQLYSKLDSANDINQHLMYELLQFEKAGNGYWKSTAVTTRVLCAIDVYIRANNLEDNNFTAEALLDGKKLIGGKFKGLGAEAVEKTTDFAEEPVKSIKRDKEIPLVFTKKGNGTLYYTATMKYAIPVQDQYARDEGICLYTEISDVKTGEVVSGDVLVAGNVYREKVYVVSTRDREYVAVRAPIPAGCEVMNAAFVTTGTFPPPKNEKDADKSADPYEDYNYGLSHQAIYDSEVQYFWNVFPKGNQQVEFLFRATRKGTYNTPSGTAECMYQPEVFGRSAGQVWTIE